jgi:hypothetical protein
MSVRYRTYALHLTLTASWPPTRFGGLFNCKHPDYRPVYGERPVRLAHSHSIWLLPAVRTKLPEAAVHDRQLGVESSHLRSLSLQGQRGNHTTYFCELLRVTVRVNLGAMRGYVRP